MRKYIIGAVAGALLLFSGQAAADTISKIGRKVQAEYAVVVDGKTLPVKAVNIDGTTATPNRALADAIGYEVSFENKSVVFTKKPEPAKEEEPLPTEAPTHNFTLDNIDDAIKSHESTLKVAKMNADQFRGVNPEKDAKNDAAIAEMEAELTRLYAIKAELEAQ